MARWDGTAASVKAYMNGLKAWPACERGHADCRTPRACRELARCDRPGCEHGKEA